MSTIHFVGGEKGGVGKSVMSRLLSQYFIDHQMIYSGLDADLSQSTMARYYQEFTKTLDLEDYESIDQIIEAATRLPQQVLIDLPAQSQKFLDRWIDDNATLELCSEMNISVLFWYVVDDGPDSAQLLTKFLAQYGELLNVVVVKNKGCGKKFDAIDAIFLGIKDNSIAKFIQHKIELPALNSATLHKIDRLNLSFWSAANVKNNPSSSLGLMERQRTKVWLRKSFIVVNEVMKLLKTSTP
jgi:hypothetical protein